MEIEESPYLNNNSIEIGEIVEIFGKEADPLEIEIANLVVDIFNETELSPYSCTDVTNTKNDVTEKKCILLRGIEQIKGGFIPESLMHDYPLQFDKETLEKAPWVNMIHAWNKVMNELNTIYSMQKGDTQVSSLVIASIAHSLYNFTTNSSQEDRFLRRDIDFLQGEKYVETIKRESGTKGVNAKRHVCGEEMKYILNTVKQSFTL